MPITQFQSADDSGSPVAFADFDILSVRPGIWDAPLQEWAFSGIDGVTHQVDYRKARDLEVIVRLRGYASHASLRGGIEQLNANINNLLGSVTIPGPLGGTYVACTFRGYRELAAPFLDGSGVHGWISTGALMWRQRTHA